MPLETIVVSDENLYDVIIIGSGPGGLTIGTILAQQHYKVGIIERSTPGGKLVDIPVIHNYQPEPNIPGTELAKRFYAQALNADVKFIYNTVSNVVKKLGYVAIYGEDGITWYAKACVVASGTENIHLNVPGENHYANFGISYCIKCDHSIVKNKRVVIVGENEQALRGTLTIQPLAKETTLILRNENYNHDLVNELTALGIKILKNYQVLEVNGDPYTVNEIVLLANDQQILKYPVDFIFVEIGYAPATTFIHDQSIIDQTSRALIVDPHQQTAIPGIYGIGDVTNNSSHQISGAVANAQTAADAIVNYLINDFEKQREMEIRIKKN